VYTTELRANHQRIVKEYWTKGVMINTEDNGNAADADDADEYEDGDDACDTQLDRTCICWGMIWEYI